MSAYEAETIREVARQVADGERRGQWPWTSVIGIYLRRGLGENYAKGPAQREHLVMSALFAAEVAADHPGSWWDFKETDVPR